MMLEKVENDDLCYFYTQQSQQPELKPVQDALVCNGVSWRSPKVVIVVVGVMRLARRGDKELMEISFEPSLTGWGIFLEILRICGHKVICKHSFHKTCVKVKEKTKFSHHHPNSQWGNRNLRW